MKKMILVTAILLMTCTACTKAAELPIPVNPVVIETELLTETSAETALTEPPVTAVMTSTSVSQTTTNQSTQSESKTTSVTNTAIVTEITEVSESGTEEISPETESTLPIVIDAEEQQAIEAVQPTEPLIYYKDPVWNFQKDSYSNLNLEFDFLLQTPNTHKGNNVHKYFFEAKPIADSIPQMKKLTEGFSGTACDSDRITAHADYLTYQDDTVSVSMTKRGFCDMYRLDTIAGILGQETEADMWKNGSNQGIRWALNSQNIVKSDDIIQSRIREAENVTAVLNGEEVTAYEAQAFAVSFLNEAVQNGWISSLYAKFTPETIELYEFANGNCGYLITFSMSSAENYLFVDGITRTDYPQNTAEQIVDNGVIQYTTGKIVEGQTIRLMMLSRETVDYLYLPPTLTQKPDETETFPATYCTLAEACEILSASLDDNHIFDVKNIAIQYETLTLSEDMTFVGMVQVPMWHFEVHNLTGAEGILYQTLFADIDADTRELYISYR